MSSARARVVVRVFEHEIHKYLKEGDVDVFIIDERFPKDRVYQLGERSVVDPKEIDGLIGDSPIGHFDDGKTPDGLAELVDIVMSAKTRPRRGGTGRRRQQRPSGPNPLQGSQGPGRRRRQGQ